MQGEQVAMLFPYIFDLGITIKFAYQTFIWKNNAKDNANVHVVIIGLSTNNNESKDIYINIKGNTSRKQLKTSLLICLREAI